MLSSAELSFEASEAAVCMFLTIPLSAPSFCFGLGNAHALRSIRRVQQQDRKSMRVLELILGEKKTNLVTLYFKPVLYIAHYKGIFKEMSDANSIY